MKKKLVSSLIVVAIVFLLTGCSSGDKTPLYEKEFREFFDGKDYTIVAVDDKVNSSAVINAFVAIKNDESYQVEYYIFDTEKNAEITFYQNRDSILDNIENSYKTFNGTNYSFIKANNETNYKVVYRIENTLLFINTSLDNKKIIEDLLKEMGY